jgi:hypothetical protein
MHLSQNILLATLDALADYWCSQKMLATPDESWNPQVVASANGVTLPDDFVQLYRCSNGMRLNTEQYQDFDDNCFYFLCAEELCSEQRVIVIESMRGVETISTNVIVFVDYMHWSWQYGFISNPYGDGYLIGIMGTHNEFKVITSSLATFLNLYMEDATVLYDHHISTAKQG